MRHLYPFFILLFLFSLSPGLLIAQSLNRPSIPTVLGIEVNSYTGGLYHKRTDLTLPGNGPGVEIAFSYNSTRRGKNWGMGRGWTFSYNMAYAVDSLGIAIERMDGRRDLFQLINGKYLPPSNVYDTLMEYQSGKFKLLTKEGTQYYFDDAGHKRLTKLMDRNNNTLNLGYADSLLTAITDASGRTLNLTWSNGRLASIADHSGRTVSYAYDDKGNPVTVTNPLGGTFRYEYDPYSKIARVLDENGNAVDILYNDNTAVKKIISCISTWTFTYSPETRKTIVVEKVGSETQTTTYEYDQNGRIAHKQGNCCGFDLKYEYNAKNQVVKVTDGNGHATHFEYDASGNKIRETDPLGNFIVWTYDPLFNRMTSTTDKNGNTTIYTYDANGNLLQVNKPLNISESFTYDSKGNRLTSTDGNGWTTAFIYDANGYLLSKTDPEGGVTAYAYDARGNKTGETDPNGNTTTYQYDALNRLTKITRPLGSITTYTYDARGNRLTMTDPNGKVTQYQYDGHDRLVQTTSAMGIVERYTYDERENQISKTDGKGNVYRYKYNYNNQLIEEKDPLNRTIQYEYDGAGNRIKRIGKLGDVTNYEYDPLNRLIRVTNALGAFTTFSYDAVGNKLSVTNARGYTINYMYDALNRVIKETDAEQYTQEIVYDKNDNIVIFKDKNNKIILFSYDKLNRSKSSVNPLGGISRTFYDFNGNPVLEINALGDSTVVVYDQLNRKISETDPINQATFYTYDLSGNLTTLNTARGNSFNYTYDLDDRLISTSDNIGAIVSYVYDNNDSKVSETDANGNTTLYSYDPLSRLVSETDPSGAQIIYGYDANGNVISKRDKNNLFTLYQYDVLSNLVGITDAQGGISNYTYDEVGNLLAVRDARNNVTSYLYNARNLIATETLPDGSTQSYTYDGNGNRISRVDFTNQVSTYTYDGLNNLTSRTYSNAITETYTYDLAGKLLTANNENAAVSFQYDRLGRLLNENLNGRSVAFEYNSTLGNKRIIYPSGREITESYDLRGRLDLVAENSANLADFTYDLANRLVARSYANGLSTSYTYDSAGKPLSIQTNPNGLIHLDYEYNAEFKKTLEKKAHLPQYSEKYNYDLNYRITNYKAGTYSGGDIPLPQDNIVLNFDPNNNLISLSRNNDVTNFISNILNQYSSIQKNNVSISTGYDQKGNLIAYGDTSFGYDFENRLVRIESGQNTRFKYDALGRIVCKVTDTDSVLFFYNDKRVIEVVKILSNQIETRVYGVWTDDVVTCRRNNLDYFYHQGQNQSVYGVSDNLGQIIEYYHYDFAGDVVFFDHNKNLIAESGIQNDILYTGRILLDKTGVYDFRSRQYFTKTFSFLQRDPVGLAAGLNLYFPYFIPSQTDPLGLSPDVEFCNAVGFNITDRVRQLFSKIKIVKLTQFSASASGSVCYTKGCCNGERKTHISKIGFEASGNLSLSLGGVNIRGEASNNLKVDFWGGLRYSGSIGFKGSGEIKSPGCSDKAEGEVCLGVNGSIGVDLGFETTITVGALEQKVGVVGSGAISAYGSICFKFSNENIVSVTPKLSVNVGLSAAVNASSLAQLNINLLGVSINLDSSGGTAEFVGSEKVFSF